MPPNQITQSDASRIQSGQAKAGGNMSSNGFVSRAQSAGDRNANASAGNNGASGSGNGGAGGGGGKPGAGNGGGPAGKK